MNTAFDRRTLPIVQQLGYGSAQRYNQRGMFIFDGLNLEGTRVLEVGCGRGAWAIYAALNRASYVLGIEPELHGSENGTLRTFRNIIQQLDLQDVVEASPLPYQDVSEKYAPFDIVVLYNVINHLNEQAVADLHANPTSQAFYTKELETLRSLAAPNACLIIADAARSNFWGSLGMRSPFARSLVWRKHQNPEVWEKLFRRSGFLLHDLRWSPLYPLGKLSANRAAQWLTMSHFVMRFRNQPG